MEASILVSTKAMLGIGPDDSSFDVDVLTHINGAFFTLTQLGIGPLTGFVVEDADTKWEDFVPVPNHMLSSVKVYIFLKVKVLFDPPQMASLQTAFDNQITQMEWRLNVAREETDWVDPDPPVPPDPEVISSS